MPDVERSMKSIVKQLFHLLQICPAEKDQQVETTDKGMTRTPVIMHDKRLC